MSRLGQSTYLLACVFTLAFVDLAVAQDTPPTGPAQIMNRAAQGRERRDAAKATAAGDKAAAASEPAAQAAPATGSDPHAGVPGAPPIAAGADPHAGVPGAPPTSGSGDPHSAPADRFQATADPASDLPKGTLQIDVVDAIGRPYAGGEIVLGIMQSMGGREEQRAKTDENGRYTFTGLPVGSAQAYRVNVPHGGAKFSSNPFRLPDDSGFRVRVPMRSTTRDDKLIFTMIGQTVVELRDDRLHVTQQARVANAGESVYVLPGDGLLVPLPKGFTAFQWQDVMTDQKGTEVMGEGFRLKGSIPPGTYSLAWAYDVTREGASARIPVAMPFHTYSYRVIAEAPEGLTLRVTDFPEAEKVKDEGRNLLFTQLRRAPPEPTIGPLTIRIDGIPGPGPGRWVAVVLFAFTVLLGLWVALKKPDDAESVAEHRRLFGERKAELLEAAKQTAAELARGEVGPQYHARRLDEIETELAMVLRDEASLTSSSAR